MRWTPTRGPQDPWTPRTITLCGRFFQFHPPRPTLDGPGPDVHLHILYAGGTSHTAGDPAPCHAPDAAKIG